MISGAVSAQNPIIQTNYTADPAPMVYNGRLYVYTTHDEDDSTWFTMNDWKVYSTNDMVNWTDHGTILSYNDFEWAKRDAWAAQCVERNGKFLCMFRCGLKPTIKERLVLPLATVR